MTRSPRLPWLVASLALVLAASSAAVSAPTVAKALTKQQVVKIAKKQSDRAVTRRAPGLTVGRAQVALSPVAFAVVNSDGSVVASSSRGITDAHVSLVNTSAYCFDLPFTFRTLQVTPVNTGGVASDRTAHVAVRGQFGQMEPCFASDDAIVSTSTNGAFAAGPFVVWFFA
jgi:hypothetical protein